MQKPAPAGLVIAMLHCLGWICVVYLLGPPAGLTDAPTTYRIERKRIPEGEFLLAVPSEYRHGDRPALVVCLHGTNTDAGDILAFWLSMRCPYPMVFVAPQSSGKGWRDTDAARVFAAVDWVRNEMTVDGSRVLLTGHSAGGAMTFHLIYERNFPATAAATTANYLPPSVTAEEIRQRKDLPVYYAVGTGDVNQERMRAGIILLRSNGAYVSVRQPNIGHVLDRQATQGAMDFFIRRNSRRIQTALHQADDHVWEDRPALAISLLQPILDHARYHNRPDVLAAESAMARIEKAAEPALVQADALIAAGDAKEAIEILYRVEKRYAGGRLARRLAERCAALSSALPATDEPQPPAAQREAEARWLLEVALKLTRQRKYAQARQKCRILLASYAGTRSAAGAKRLLGQLNLFAPP